MPGITYRELTEKLRSTGFFFFRQAAGSHEVWKNDEGVRIMISNHSSKPISTGLLSKIVKQAGFKNIQDFQNFKP